MLIWRRYQLFKNVVIFSLFDKIQKAKAPVSRGFCYWRINITQNYLFTTLNTCTWVPWLRVNMYMPGARFCPKCSVSSCSLLSVCRVYTLPLMSVSWAVKLDAASMASAPFKFTLKLCSNGLAFGLFGVELWVLVLNYQALWCHWCIYYTATLCIFSMSRATIRTYANHELLVVLWNQWHIIDRHAFAQGYPTIRWKHVILYI